ncbi:hypothetical protein [Prosthecobacter sp.]|uniref:hypothetical protein n=1 Tax=Prosthecobacter sp. TaxID=1965333 RepID=UPI001DF7C867|nr:hypothetical protein [Prosthecobacter sp.]MCB1276974.1 hypothetical protein [Prosthecobacter sp.]
MILVESRRVNSPTAPWLLWLGIVLLACVALLSARVSSAVTLDRPYLGQTSGLEEEALFSLWKAHHGMPVYTDALSPPFSASYFNSLFYTTYAAWSRLWAVFGSFDDAWLPTIWRVLSLLFCLGIWLVLWRVIRSACLNVECRPSSWFAMIAAGLCVFNPLFHWMSFSVRPDVAAVLGEVVCLGFLLAHVRRFSWACLLGAGCAAALAWSFKQSQGFAFAGGCGFLLWHRRWLEFALFVLPLLIVVPATLGLAGEWYRQNTLTLHALASQFSAGQGMRLAMSALAKTPFMIAGLLLLFPLIRRWRDLEPDMRLMVMVVVLSIPLCLFTSSKIGAADYYYLAPSVFASVLLFSVLVRSLAAGMVDAMGRSCVKWFVSGSLLLQLVVVGLIFAGRLGKVSVREDQALAVRLQQRLAHEEGPVLVTGRPYNLPWLQPGRPAFVFSFLYDEYEKHHPELREHGLRALVQQGYFRVVVDVDDPPLDFSREIAGSCKLAEVGEGFRVYRPMHP